MSLFGKILEKLGLRKDKEEEKTTSTGTVGSTPSKPPATAPKPKATAPAKPSASTRTAVPGTKTTGVSGRDEADNISKQPVRPAAAPPGPRGPGAAPCADVSEAEA